MSPFLALLGEPRASPDLVLCLAGEAVVSSHTPAPERSIDTLEVIFWRAELLEQGKFPLDLAPFDPLSPAGFYSILQHHSSLSRTG